MARLNPLRIHKSPFVLRPIHISKYYYRSSLSQPRNCSIIFNAPNPVIMQYSGYGALMLSILSSALPVLGAPASTKYVPEVVYEFSTNPPAQRKLPHTSRHRSRLDDPDVRGRLQRCYSALDTLRVRIAKAVAPSPPTTPAESIRHSNPSTVSVLRIQIAPRTLTNILSLSSTAASMV